MAVSARLDGDFPEATAEATADGTAVARPAAAAIPWVRARKSRRDSRSARSVENGVDMGARTPKPGRSVVCHPDWSAAMKVG